MTVCRGRGHRAVLEAGRGYRELVEASDGAAQAASFLVVERLVEVANVQAEAIKNLPLDKVIVWDSGSGDGGLKFRKRVIGALPHARPGSYGRFELPDYL